MKRLLIVTAAIALAAATKASATNINFATFSPLDTGLSTASVGGFNFNNPGQAMYVWSGNPNDPGIALIYGFSGAVEVDEGGTAFTLNDLDMTISWYDSNPTETVDVVGNLEGGGMVDTTLTLGQGLQVYDLNWADLSSFTISAMASGAGYWALDNMDVNASTSPVPEPGTWLLLGTGLLAPALQRLRGRTRKAD